jgi:hypothetical protein
VEVFKGAFVIKKAMIKNIIMIGSLMGFTVFSCLWGTENYVCLFSLDYLYPQRHFYQVESTSKELWSELDLILSDSEARIQCIEKSNLMFDQFKKMHKTINSFVSHEKEANTYLADDVEYLLGILDCIEEKFLKIAQLGGTRQVMMVSMYTLLLESKALLDELLVLNQEVSMI